MHLLGPKLLAYAGWNLGDRRKAEKRVRWFLRRRVFRRLGEYGSRVGRLQIVIACMADCLVRVSNREVAVSVLSDVLDQVRKGEAIKADLDRRAS